MSQGKSNQSNKSVQGSPTKKNIETATQRRIFTSDAIQKNPNNIVTSHKETGSKKPG